MSSEQDIISTVNIASISINSDGSTMVAGGADTKIRIYTYNSVTSQYTNTANITGFTGNIDKIKITPDSFIIIAGTTNGVYIWKNNQGTYVLVQTITDGTGNVMDIDISADVSYTYLVVGWSDNNVRLYINSGWYFNLQQTIPDATGINVVELNNRGNILAIGSNDNHLRTY